MSYLFSDDDDRDIQADRAVDYGKRHQAIDILWMGTCNLFKKKEKKEFLDLPLQPSFFLTNNFNLNILHPQHHGLFWRTEIAASLIYS